MSNTMNREEMIAEAIDFGIEFKGNISNVNLAALLAEYKGEPVPVQEAAPKSPPEKKEESMTDEETLQARRQREAQEKFAKRRQQIQDAKKKAMAKRIVTLTNKDPRENEVVTTAYLAMENQHFGIARLVPLDVPVELEECLIRIATMTPMTQHRDEIIKGRRTGNKVTVTVKKYAVSYSSQKSADEKKAEKTG